MKSNLKKKKKGDAKARAAGKNLLVLALTCRCMYTIVPAGISPQTLPFTREGKIITFGNNRLPQRQRLHRTPQPPSKRVVNAVWNSTDFTQVSPHFFLTEEKTTQKEKVLQSDAQGNCRQQRPQAIFSEYTSRAVRAAHAAEALGRRGSSSGAGGSPPASLGDPGRASRRPLFGNLRAAVSPSAHPPLRSSNLPAQA